MVEVLLAVDVAEHHRLQHPQLIGPDSKVDVRDREQDEQRPAQSMDGVHESPSLIGKQVRITRYKRCVDPKQHHQSCRDNGQPSHHDRRVIQLVVQRVLSAFRHVYVLTQLPFYPLDRFANVAGPEPDRPEIKKERCVDHVVHDRDRQQNS